MQQRSTVTGASQRHKSSWFLVLGILLLGTLGCGSQNHPQPGEVVTPKLEVLGNWRAGQVGKAQVSLLVERNSRPVLLDYLRLPAGSNVHITARFACPSGEKVVQVPFDLDC